MAEGARVALVDALDEVQTAAGELAAGGQTVKGFRADVTDYAAVQRAVEAIRGGLGPIEHVFFAVGIGSGKFGFPFWNLEPADWPRVLSVNLIGAANVAHAVAPAMAAERRGTMLFISSIAGQIGSQTDPPYSAAKAGLINFAQCAAKDLAPYGVRVNTLCPGMIQTVLNRSVWQAWADRQSPEHVERLRPVGQRKDPAPGAAGPLANARGRGRDGRLSGFAASPERHRPDDQRRRRLRDALVGRNTGEGR